MTRNLPALNAALLCSYVDFDADQRPFRLVEPIYALAATPDGAGRLMAPDFMLFVQLDDEHALGTFWLTAEVRTSSGFVLPGGRLRPQEVAFAGSPDPLVASEHVLDVCGLVFPQPGRYYLHVMCNHTSLHTATRLVRRSACACCPARQLLEGDPCRATCTTPTAAMVSFVSGERRSVSRSTSATHRTSR